MMNKVKDRLDRLGYILSYKQLRFRKWTTLIHWAFGYLCCFFIYAFGILAGWGMMGMLAGMEAWNDYCEGTKQGCADWWEAFLTFCVGQGVLAILHCLGMINIGWY